MFRTVLSLAFLVALLNILVQAQLKNTIIDGDCNPNKTGSLLHHEVIKMRAQWHQRLRTLVSYEGNPIISCLKIRDLTKDGTGGVPKIIIGGVGKQYLAAELVSQNGRGLQFDVQIFGAK